MKYRIACDIDDVLNNLNEKTIEFFNREYGGNLTPDMFISYNIYECLSFEDAQKFCELWLRKDLWDSLTPVANSQRGIKKLIDLGLDVYLATATHYENFPWKVQWLKNNYNIDESRIICIQDKSILDVDVMIDDNVDNLLGNLHCNRILFNKPWNTNVNDDVYGIVRCDNWNEIVEAVRHFYNMDKEMMAN